MAQKIYLAFLWHQHQPFYKDLKSGQAIMPWVRLHGTKDYYDMAAILDDFPKVRMTFNLVPSLLAQLQDFAQNQCSDPWLEKTLIPAKQLNADDKLWILEHFFYCNWDTMIFTRPRFGELFEKRGKFAGKEELKRKVSFFSEQDYLDLQVWFNLTWMDPYWQEKDALIGGLFKKGRNFTEADKQALIAKQREICGAVIGKHKELWDRGQIEVSTTPFYHPILPLLCDTDAAQMSMPGSLKPRTRFRHPEDAQAQVEKALSYMESVFGRRPTGMWPSEGSVSEEVAGILARAGVKWAATDEAVLFHSLRLSHPEQSFPRDHLFQSFDAAPESLQSQGAPRLRMVFRDHSLSDAIGFVYSRTDPEKAANDFIQHLTRIADAVPDSIQNPLVSIILDGENCWEYYSRDGRDFLKTLYGALSDHPRIETVTIGDYVQRFPAQQTLPKLWAGSWINSDFAIWIGHPEDNTAWELVGEARDFLMKFRDSNPDKAGSPEFQNALESLYIAEGSDWCWWYGDQNSTAQDEVFDQLFRKHVANIYGFLGAQPPDRLNLAIKRRETKGMQSSPVDFITPKIDGLRTNYFEWRAGGSYHQQAAPGGAMHQAKNHIGSLYYGFDLEKLYLRLDFLLPPAEIDLQPLEICVRFMEPNGVEARFKLGASGEGKTRAPRVERAELVRPGGTSSTLPEAAIQKIFEAAIPLSELFQSGNEAVEFSVQILENGLPVETWPYESSIRLKRPSEDFALDYWSA